MLIIYSSLLAIPTEIYEAAKLDGASQLRIALSIKIPMVIPAIVLTAVFSIIGTLQLLTEPTVFRQFTSTISSTFTPNMLVYSTSSVPNFKPRRGVLGRLAVATFVLSIGFLRLNPAEGRPVTVNAPSRRDLVADAGRPLEPNRASPAAPARSAGTA